MGGRTPSSCEYEADIQRVPLTISLARQKHRGDLIKIMYVLMTERVTQMNEEKGSQTALWKDESL